MNPGDQIANRYTLVRTIGAGGMGEVFQAQRLSDGALVAIKILREELLKNAEAVARFHREARAASALRSENAARILDFGELANSQPYLVMEYLAGHDLMTEIEKRGTMPLSEAVHYVAQACNAMIEAHQLGIVHRDLKPPNLFLATGAGGRTIKVLDFGISKITQAYDGAVTSTQMSFGSPLYMSPEQIRSTKTVDARSDVWSLGVILYECVMGEPPFFAETPGALAVIISTEPYAVPSQKRPGLPAAFDLVIARTLEKDANRRYQSVQEFRRAIEQFLPHDFSIAASGTAEDPKPEDERTSVGFGSATQPAVSEASQAPKRERAGLLAAALLIPVGAFAFGFAIWLYSQRDPDPVALDPKGATSPRTSAAIVTQPALTVGAPSTDPSAIAMVSSYTPSTATSTEPVTPAASVASSTKARPKLPKPKPTQFVPPTP